MSFKRNSEKLSLKEELEKRSFKFMLRRGNYSRLKVKITMWDGNYGWE
jgi:hypothetical protein